MFRAASRKGIVFGAFAGSLLLAASPGGAHDLHRDVSAGEAVMIRFYYADDTSFSYESYEVFRKGEEIPFQVGRTDALGRLVFIPDRGGEWRVRVFSEDGHGADFTVEAGAEGQVATTEKPLFDRYVRMVVGIAVILGLFGALRLFVARSARRSVGEER